MEVKDRRSLVCVVTRDLHSYHVSFIQILPEGNDDGKLEGIMEGSVEGRRLGPLEGSKEGSLEGKEDG